MVPGGEGCGSSFGGETSFLPGGLENGCWVEVVFSKHPKHVKRLRMACELSALNGSNVKRYGLLNF